MQEIEVTFPGGKRVDARIGDHVVHTDQPINGGGSDSSPSPFELFLASLATCAGYYVLEFCQQRGLSTDDIRVAQQVDLDPVTHRPTRVRITLTLPPSFPEKYRTAVVRAAESCKVKKTIADSPPMDVVLAPAALATVAHPA